MYDSETDEDGYSYTDTGSDAVSGGEIIDGYKLRASQVPCGIIVRKHSAATCSLYLVVRNYKGIAPAHAAGYSLFTS